MSSETLLCVTFIFYRCLLKTSGIYRWGRGMDSKNSTNLFEKNLWPVFLLTNLLPNWIGIFFLLNTSAPATKVITIINLPLQQRLCILWVLEDFPLPLSLHWITKDCSCPGANWHMHSRKLWQDKLGKGRRAEREERKEGGEKELQDKGRWYKWEWGGKKSHPLPVHWRS